MEYVPLVVCSYLTPANAIIIVKVYNFGKSEVKSFAVYQQTRYKHGLISQPFAMCKKIVIPTFITVLPYHMLKHISPMIYRLSVPRCVYWFIGLPVCGDISDASLVLSHFV